MTIARMAACHEAGEGAAPSRPRMCAITELNRDLAFQIGVGGAVHPAHAVHTEQGDDFERAEA